MRRRLRTLGALVTLSASLLAFSTTTATAATPTSPASAATWVVSAPRIVARFDVNTGQSPEGIALEPTGSALISLANASAVVRVRRDGQVEPVGQLPRSGACPILGGSYSSGIARGPDGTVYVLNCTGSADSGVWRIRRGGVPEQIARLPVQAFPNGLALDERTGDLYAADSALGVIWKVPTTGGTPRVWASGPELTRDELFGANGITVHRGQVWVSNTDRGTIMRIPIGAGGAAGPIRTMVSGLTGGVDNFTVFGPDDTILAPLIATNEIVLIRPGQQPQVVLTAADGLSNPTHVQLRGDTVYVSNSAFFTRVDPNLLVAHLDRRAPATRTAA
ncbi:hypothetical protein MXD61_07925 [Frankia sp. AgPm24]|uniref:SMP-30/gluconolactonase/LRE family protein n=1 Tax=Frankia sp. AgPm24 TaxID=631128 RepID=UPI00200BEE9D|nr:hypothetical protein [Frankia sp. AgPm24]MCK9921817.1 hypothetical protein [Frankia sp. AgPm24]